MIYSRFGSVITLKRLATIEDVKTFENRRADKQDKERTAEHCRFIATFADDGKDRLVDVSFLHADDGIREIATAVRALLPADATTWAKQG